MLMWWGVGVFRLLAHSRRDRQLRQGLHWKCRGSGRSRSGRDSIAECRDVDEDTRYGAMVHEGHQYL